MSEHLPAVRDEATLDVARPRMTNDQVALLKRTICRGATDDEMDLFLELCRAKGLDPFSKQIHFTRRSGRNNEPGMMVPITGIDGYRLIAQRSGQYAGQTPAYWCGEDGAWKDVWLAPKPPAAAKIGVYRQGFAEPVWAVATYRSYAPVNRDGNATGQWGTMPDVMLAKVAESLALRKAFPNETSGLYTTEEMGQANNPVPVSEVVDTVTGEITDQPRPALPAPKPAAQPARGKAAANRAATEQLFRKFLGEADELQMTPQEFGIDPVEIDADSVKPLGRLIARADEAQCALAEVSLDGFADEDLRAMGRTVRERVQEKAAKRTTEESAALDAVVTED